MLKINFNWLNQSSTLFNFISISFNKEKKAPLLMRAQLASKKLKYLQLLNYHLKIVKLSLVGGKLELYKKLIPV